MRLRMLPEGAMAVTCTAGDNRKCNMRCTMIDFLAQGYGSIGSAGAIASNVSRK